MLYIGGQNAVTAAGAWIGLGDEAAQTAQAMKNVMACLEAVGAGVADLVSLEIKVVEGSIWRCASELPPAIWI